MRASSLTYVRVSSALYNCFLCEKTRLLVYHICMCELAPSSVKTTRLHSCDSCEVFEIIAGLFFWLQWCSVSSRIPVPLILLRIFIRERESYGAPVRPERLSNLAAGANEPE